MSLEQTQAELAALRSLVKSGQLHVDTYNKLVVMKACEFALLDDDVKSAVLLLQSVPVSYFEGAQQTQLIEDPDYCERSFMLAQKLEDAGVFEEPLQPNMPGGDA